MDLVETPWAEAIVDDKKSAHSRKRYEDPMIHAIMDADDHIFRAVSGSCQYGDQSPPHSARSTVDAV